MGQVPRYPGGVLFGIQDAPDPVEILGFVAYVGKFWWILLPPLQGIPWGKPRQSFVPYYFQRGDGRRNLALGDGGGTYGGGSRGTQGDDLGVGGFLLCG